MRLLLVEDDAILSEELQKLLHRAGYAVDVAYDGVEGEAKGQVESYDLAVLDLGLPQRSGLEVLRNWRERGNTMPILILTARDAWNERVDGLKAGADDYLGKPFHEQELLARIAALLRRSHGKPTPGLEVAGISLDEDRQTAVTPNGEEHTLTGTEFRLLRYFMLHPGKVLSKIRLTDHVYESDADRDSNVIEVYVTRLRNKVGKDLIQTKRGQGYVFAGNKK